jgi:phospholipid/cholesterol/gamma-HCH transport system permease protein
METYQVSESCQYDVLQNEDGSVTVNLQGRMDAGNAGRMIKAVKSHLENLSPSALTVNLENVTYLDDFGALVLVEIKNSIRDPQSEFRLTNARDNVKNVLSVLNFENLVRSTPFASKSLTKNRRPNMFLRLGEGIFRQASDLRFILLFIGSVCLAIIHIIRNPKSLRVNDTISEMEKIGVDALPIVCLISFLLGLIIAFMSSVQLRQFGANIYVASLVSLAMVRELGPIMTAIIVAGRSGSAFAAEIGTMKISEEVDALFTMGFEPTRFLVLPKLVAALITVPILTLFSNVFAIMGGLVVGVLMLDLTTNSYITQTIKTLTIFDISVGFFKSGVFAMLITMVGCLRGFQVRGGAAAVGQATTSAVVSSIFLIILSDSVFAVILRYW